MTATSDSSPETAHSVEQRDTWHGALLLAASHLARVRGAGVKRAFDPPFHPPIHPSPTTGNETGGRADGRTGTGPTLVVSFNAHAPLNLHTPQPLTRYFSADHNQLEGTLSEALLALPRSVEEVHLEDNHFVEVTHAGEFESIVERERDERARLKREGLFTAADADGGVLTKKGASEDDAYVGFRGGGWGGVCCARQLRPNSANDQSTTNTGSVDGPRCYESRPPLTPPLLCAPRYAEILLAKQKRIHQRTRIKQRQAEAREQERAAALSRETTRGVEDDEAEIDNGSAGVVEVPLHLRKVAGYTDSHHVRRRALVDDDCTAAEAETEGLVKVVHAVNRLVRLRGLWASHNVGGGGGGGAGGPAAKPPRPSRLTRPSASGSRTCNGRGHLCRAAGAQLRPDDGAGTECEGSSRAERGRAAGAKTAHNARHAHGDPGVQVRWDGEEGGGGVGGGRCPSAAAPEHPCFVPSGATQDV